MLPLAQSLLPLALSLPSLAQSLPSLAQSLPLPAQFAFYQSCSHCPVSAPHGPVFLLS